ncbi:HipA family kinase [Longispora albida]|uniref:HipA family kinase n=1 Tax=Longispora albida TaxID=203523 RepID=UPI0006864722|nr:HipA family kinase [Longispora albida]
MLPKVTAIRYVTPLREGGSLPGLLEADDLGTYVVKFRGAGQGPKALAAEIIGGELARRLGLRVPDLVLAELDPAIAPGEPDPEIQHLLKASPGDNLGMDFLPGALGFDPAGFSPDPALAARVLWFDALIENVDRSWRNPNMLVWHKELWLIDHGASLYFHHNWPRAASYVGRSYKWDDHVLAPFARDMAGTHAALAPQVTPDLLREVTALIPDEWLADEPGFGSPDEVRAAYVSHLGARLAAADSWLPEGRS